MSNAELRARLDATLNRVAKWRGVFAGWQLGTRSADDPESRAVRDHRELSMMLRIEVSALVAVLINKGVLTEEEWFTQLIEEAEHLDRQNERRFPGFRATDVGINMTMPQAAETLKNFPE